MMMYCGNHSVHGGNGDGVKVNDGGGGECGGNIDRNDDRNVDDDDEYTK